MNIPRISVIVTDGKHAKQHVFDQPQVCVVGRAPECDIRVGGLTMGDTEVSRFHCLVEIDPPHLRVRDLGSVHGTFVNGKRIWRGASEVQHGDEIAVGHVTLRLLVAELPVAVPEPIGCP